MGEVRGHCGIAACPSGWLTDVLNDLENHHETVDFGIPTWLGQTISGYIYLAWVKSQESVWGAQFQLIFREIC